MCGIIGYTGNKNAVKVITSGLTNLEYRGYDSAGIAVFSQNGLVTVKTTGRVSTLKEKTEKLRESNTFCGIGHTRWATHGVPSERNCHPHKSGAVSVVHNGIIENYKELRADLKGAEFLSDTDTEVIAHLIDREYTKTHNPILSIIRTRKFLKGSFALGIIFEGINDCVFALRNDSPLLIGLGENENFLASDTVAFSEFTDRFLRLSDGDIARIKPDCVDIFDSYGNSKTLKEETVQEIRTEQTKDGYRHHMLREIFEAPGKMRDTFDSLTKDGLPFFPESVSNMFSDRINSIYIIACGTALHSGLIGRHFFEELSEIPVRTEPAGEFRYNKSVITKNDVAIIISQSGETADSLAVLRLLKKKGIKTLAIVNAVGSTIAVEAENVIYTLAGKETAVASTKAFNVQCQTLLILAVELGLKRGIIDKNTAKIILRSHSESFVNAIPALLKNTKQFASISEYLKNHRNAFFIGRGYDSSLGSEGSLKLKEISYIHSESFPASELKHGTISLIEEGTPVIAVATDETLYEKLRSNILEVKSRGATVISICPENAEIIRDASDFTVILPDSEKYSLPFTTASALQLLAYYTALEMGRDIDKPRNLAKSVTVE